MPTTAELSAKAKQSAKQAYVAGAHAVSGGARRLNLIRDEAPPREQRARHWLHSLGMVHDSVAMAGLDVPWWTYRAIEDVDRWLAARPHPIRVFEYGSGASTIWLARRADRVTSVEHHRGFAEHMQPTLARYPNIELHIVEGVPAEHPVVGSLKEGYAGVDFADYVATIDKVGGEFDLVVIDGRAREACLLATLPHLAADGLIVFDNSLRGRYRRAIQAAGVSEQRDRGLTPTLPYPEQTSLLRVAR